MPTASNASAAKFSITGNADLNQTSDQEEGFPYQYYDSEDEALRLENLLTTPVHITIVLLALLGLVANVCGVVSLTRHWRRKRDCSRSRLLLLISLSVSDMLLCISVPLRTYVRAALDYHNINQLNPQSFYCGDSFLDILIPMSQSISLLNLVGMAIDHWITFAKPLHYYEILNKKNTFGMIAGFWLLALTVGVSEYLSGLPLLGQTFKSGEPVKSYCQLVFDDVTYHPDYMLLAITPICLISMTIIYCAIFREIRKIIIYSPPQQQDFGQARRALYATLFILGTFLFCWLPGFSLTLVLNISAAHYTPSSPGFFKDRETIQRLHDVSQWLFALLISNSILDPIIYMSHFRTRFSMYCYSLKDKIYQRFVTVAEDAQFRADVSVTTRMSLQYTGNTMQMEPLCQ